jgi:drug/metabolite transporter (DMT)-like permease
VSRRGWLLFTMMCLVWGVSYLLIKVAVREVSVPVLVFLRTGLAALVLLPLAARFGRARVSAALRRHWRPLLAFAVLEIIGPWWFLSAAERDLTSSLAGLIVAAVPIVGVLVSRLLGDAEPLGVARWAGLVIGLVGVGVLAAPALHGDSAVAVGEMLLVVLGYSTAPIIAARRLPEVPNLLMTTACLTFAALVYAPVAVLRWPRSWPSLPVLGSLIGLAVVCTALAFLAFFALIREVGTARALVFTYVNPAVAVAAGVLVLGEPLTPAIVASFGLILGGSVLATASARRPGLSVEQG